MRFEERPRAPKFVVSRVRATTGIVECLPLFWRFQIGGWLAFIIFSIPLNWVILPDVPSSLMLSAGRDSFGFFLTLGMREIYRRFYVSRLKPAALALVAGLVSISGGAIYTLFSLGSHRLLDGPNGMNLTPSVLFAIFYFRTVICAGWSLLYFEIKIVLESMSWETELAHRDAEKQRLEVQMLRAQMNPHFLFNALNTISASIGKPSQHPIELIQALSDYLRYSLKNRDAELVPLGDELDAIAAFFAVEQARFRDSLVVETDVEPAARTKLVQGILLQPLIENAIKHGQKTSPQPLKVRLRVFRPSLKALRIEVWNTGHWVKRSVPSDSTHGVGLINLRQRLEISYHGKQTFDISETGGWVCVSIQLPIPT